MTLVWGTSVSPGGLDETQMAGLHGGDSDSLGLGTKRLVGKDLAAGKD